MTEINPNLQGVQTLLQTAVIRHHESTKTYVREICCPDYDNIKQPLSYCEYCDLKCGRFYQLSVFYEKYQK